MVVKSLLYYALAVLAAVLVFLGVCFAAKKCKKHIRPLHMLFGALGFIVMLVAMFALMLFAFSENSTLYMTAYLPEGMYKVIVAILFFALISLIRYLSLNAVYFNRDKTDEGESFLAGFGYCGCALIGIYSVFMFFTVAFTAIASDYEKFQAGTMLFKDGSVISVFTPLYSHVLLVLVFAVYTALCMIIGEFMTQHSSLPYKKLSTFIVYLLTSLCELVTVCTVLFAVSSVNTVVIIIVAAIALILAALSVTLLYKYKEELPYNKQFD